LEFGLRYYRIGDDERNLLYSHDDDLGWFPEPNISRDFTGAVKIHIQHNSLGFRDKEFIKSKERDNLIFLGDSFAYGYDSNIENRFSELVANELQSFNVYNLGVSGYSTDQEYLLLQKFADFFDPKIVYLLYHHNDWNGNSVNEIYNGYYKPYFSLVKYTNSLKLNGVPVPKSIKHLKHDFPLIFRSKIAIWLTHIFYSSKINEVKVMPEITFEILLQLRKFVEENLNAKFKIGIVGNGHTPGLNEFLSKNEFDAKFIDQNKSEEFFTSSGHWTKLGNERAAKKILQHLQPKKINANKVFH
jgi:hypothetical protein